MGVYVCITVAGNIVCYLSLIEIGTYLLCEHLVIHTDIYLVCGYHYCQLVFKCYLFIHCLQSVLNMYPYHIDSLIQLSEVCKMSEDLQMAAELIGM